MEVWLNANSCRLEGSRSAQNTHADGSSGGQVPRGESKRGRCHSHRFGLALQGPRLSLHQVYRLPVQRLFQVEVREHFKVDVYGVCGPEALGSGRRPTTKVLFGEVLEKGKGKTSPGLTTPCDCHYRGIFINGEEYA